MHNLSVKLLEREKSIQIGWDAYKSKIAVDSNTNTSLKSYRDISMIKFGGTTQT